MLNKAVYCSLHEALKTLGSSFPPQYDFLEVNSNRITGAVNSTKLLFLHITVHVYLGNHHHPLLFCALVAVI